MKSLYETTLSHNWSRRLYEEANKSVDALHMDKIFYVIFVGTANLFKKMEVSVDKPAAILIQKADNSTVAAAICQFVPGDNGEAGNYVLSWTFDPEDVPENANKVTLQSTFVTESINNAAMSSKYSFSFKNIESLVSVVCITFSELYKWLDENAKEGEEVGIEVADVMTASVVVENGIKVFSIEPAGAVKALVKKDDKIEK